MKDKELRHIIREEIKLIIEEKGLTKKFDKTVSLYQQLSKEVQNEINKFKQEFPKSSDKEEYKKKYIEKMKPLQDKLKKAQVEYENAIRNLPIPDEDLD